MKSVVWVSIALGAVMPAVRPAIANAQQSASPLQAVTSQFLAQRGALIEILGLGRWTPAMLQDSLAVRAPNASPTSPKLAATLRDKLGFPETMAQRQAGDSAVNVLIAVIEPQEKARIRRRNLGTDKAASPNSPWPELAQLARTKLGLLSDALEPPIYARSVGLPPAVPLELRPDSSEVRQVWATLERHRQSASVNAANKVLSSSPNVYDRLGAVAVLSNFENEDAAWHAMAGAILDPDTSVSALARRVLRSFATHAPRNVDWRPAAQDLHAILNGSALARLGTVLDVLVITGAGPDLAKPLLNDGGHAVLMFAGAANPAFRLPSHRLLRAVSGENRGTPEEWRAWIAGLGR